MLSLPTLPALETLLSKLPTPRKAGAGGGGRRGVRGASSGDTLRDLLERGRGITSRGVGAVRTARGKTGEISSAGNSTGDCGS